MERGQTGITALYYVVVFLYDILGTKNCMIKANANLRVTEATTKEMQNPFALSSETGWEHNKVDQTPGARIHVGS